MTIVASLAAGLVLAASAAAETRKTSAQFDTALGPLKVGIFWLDGDVSDRALYGHGRVPLHRVGG